MLRHITRKRPLDTSANEDEEGGAKLDKCLTTLDLVSLGVGSCCGAGMYLTSGIVAAQKAGPGGVVSILMAGLGSVLTGIHYAELAGICPHTSGSAYMYAYVTVGELSAFLIGWGLIVEYVIGTAAAAVALSQTFHSLTEQRVALAIDTAMDKIGFPHVDLVAAVVCLLLTWILASGVHMSARVNNVLNGLSMLTWVIFVGAATYLGSTNNWTEHGGFLPYGYTGVLSAIPTAYYAFVGFDGLATTGAECKTPVRSIPVSIVLSILINIVIFITMVAGLTLALPYSQLPPTTATIDVFSILGHPPLKYMMAVGAVSGLFAATFGSLFPLPRVVQAMAQDGLFYRYFAHVCPKRHTAVRATVLSGLVATFLGACVELTLLIELVLIGTLLAYVIVTFATLVLRFVNVNHVDVSANECLPEDLRQGQSSHSANGSLSSMNRRASYKGPDFLDSKKDEESVLNPQTSSHRQTSLSRQTSLDRQTPQSDSESPPRTENGGVVNKGYQIDDTSTYQRSYFKSSPLNFDSDYKEIAAPGIEANHTTPSLQNNMPSMFEFDTPSHDSGMRKQNICKTRSVLIKFEKLSSYLEQNVSVLLLALYCSLTLMCAILSNFFAPPTKRNILAFVCLIVTMVIGTCLATVLMLLPQVKSSREGFRAPFVPLVTVFTATINIYLMTSLRMVTWLLFLAWLAVGLAIYLLYGVHHSALSHRADQRNSEMDNDDCGEPREVTLQRDRTGFSTRETVPLLP